MAKNYVRNYGRKALSVMLSIIMLISLMQISVLATEDIAAEPVAEEVEAASRVSKQGQPVTEDGVTIRKTAEDLGDNLFEITLQVTIPEDVEVTTYDPVRVVMVIDSSSSMTNYGVQRLANAKVAAKTLVDALLTEEGIKAGNQVALATYNKSGRTVSEFTNNLAALKSDIDGIGTSQGTNVQAGLKEARDILAADSSFQGPQIVIVLSDGEATYSELAVGTADWTGCNHSDRKNNSKSVDNLEFTGFAYGTQSSGLNGTPAFRVTATCAECGRTTDVDVTDNRRFVDDHADAAVYEAGLLKEEDVDVYAIFVGDDGNDSTTSMMNSIATDSSKSISVSDDELESLADLFETIAIDVTSQVTTAGTVTDPMGDYVTIDEAADESIDVVDNENLIWNVTGVEPVENDGGSKTYTVSYTITLNTKEEGFESRKPYPANDTTTFTYWKDGVKNEIDFDIPEIWGENPPVDLTATKVWDKDGKYVIQPTSATVQLMKNGEPEGESVELNDENDWTVEWTDLDGDFTWTVEELNIPADWEVSYETEGDTVTITNFYTGEDQTPPAEITIVKVWENVLEGVELPESITYTVNGAEFTMTATDANESGEWVDVIEVKQADEYVIEETNVGEEWDVSVDGLTITNTYANVGGLRIVKTSNDAALIPADTLFTITGSPGYSAEVAYSEFVDGVYELENLIPGTYTVVESGAGVEGYTLEVSGNNQSLEVSRGEVAEFAISNTYTVIPPDTGSLKIVKTSNLLNLVPAETLFTIEGPEYHAEVAYSEFNNGSEHIISGLEVGTYTVTESGAEVDGYELSVEGNGGEAVITKDATAEIVINNTYTAEVGSLTITKTVYGLEENAVMPAETAFQLLNGNTLIKTVAWAEFENGSITVADLPVGNYTVNEVGALVDGYSGPATLKIYDGDGANEAAAVTIGGTGTVEITNTYKKIETAFYYDVVHEFYTNTNGEGYQLDGTGAPVQRGPVEVAPGSTALFNSEAKTDSFNGATYARLDEYAEGEVTRTGILKDKTLVYTVKYYKTDWTEGGLVIEKKIEGLDQKTERSLKSDLEFRVTGSEYDETFSFANDFNSKGRLTLENLEPGTYTIEEINAEVGGGYDLTVKVDGETIKAESFEVEVEAGPKAAEVDILNRYTGRVYNIWFDGGSHGTVKSEHGDAVDGIWRKIWWQYDDGENELDGGRDYTYDWASRELQVGETVYQSSPYSSVEVNPEIAEGTALVLYNFTAADWSDTGKEMYTFKHELEVEDGWVTDGKFYLDGTDEAFTNIADAVEYMNENVSPDANGFYNVVYRAVYENDVNDNPNPPPPIIYDDDDDDEPVVVISEEEVPLAEVPVVELPEEEVPLVEIPDSDVPLTGDSMMLYMALAAVSGMGLVYLGITGKKREEETAE